MSERTCQRPGCGRPIPGRRRKDTRWCGRACESRAHRAAKRRAAFEARDPAAAELLRAEDQSLTELYERARRPAHSDDPEVPDDQADDDDSPGAWDREDPGAWRHRTTLHGAVEAVEARFEQDAALYLAQLKRNPGRVQPPLAALMRARDAEIRELEKAFARSADAERSRAVARTGRDTMELAAW